MTVFVPEEKYFKSLMVSLRTLHFSLSRDYSADKPGWLWGPIFSAVKVQVQKNCLQTVSLN